MCHEHGEVKHPKWLLVSPAVGGLFARLRFEVATPVLPFFFRILGAKGVLADVEDMKAHEMKVEFPVLRGL